MLRRNTTNSFTFSTVPNAYLFLTAALLFGLPLLTAYYGVNPTFFVVILFPYLLVSALVTLFIVRRSLGRDYTDPEEADKILRSMFTENPQATSYISKLNSVVPSYLVMGLATATVGMYALVHYLVAFSYPMPPPASLNTAGAIYVALLIITSIVGFSRAIFSSFPILRRILVQRKYALMTSLFSIGFAIVYLLVVNGILIVGVNTPANTPSLSGSYPFFYPPMAPATLNPLADIVYLPTLVLQPIYQVNFIIIPFEVVFTALISLLVGSNIAMAHYLVSSNALRGCFTKGAALSTGGSVLGLTATCPTCLAPSFISAIFGGIGVSGLSSAQALYSSFYGITLPPLISVITLVLSLVYLSKSIEKRTK